MCCFVKASVFLCLNLQLLNIRQRRRRRSTSTAEHSHHQDSQPAARDLRRTADQIEGRGDGCAFSSAHISKSQSESICIAVQQGRQGGRRREETDWNLKDMNISEPHTERGDDGWNAHLPPIIIFTCPTINGILLYSTVHNMPLVPMLSLMLLLALLQCCYCIMSVLHLLPQDAPETAKGWPIGHFLCVRDGHCLVAPDSWVSLQRKSLSLRHHQNCYSSARRTTTKTRP